MRQTADMPSIHQYLSSEAPGLSILYNSYLKMAYTTT